MVRRYGPARGQRRRGDRQAQPDHHRVGRLLPDRGVQARLRRAGRPPVEAGLEVGQVSHPNKPRRWIVTRYFGMFNPARQDKWVFGSRQTGFYLRKFAWTKIVRHRRVAGRASPDDPALTGYWEQRRRRARLPVDPATWHLLRRQRGRCPLCRGLLLHADHQPQDPGEWQQWHTATRKAIRKHAITSAMDLGTPDERAAHHLIHAHCRRRIGSGTYYYLPGPRAFRACLSRAARKAGTAGSEGTPARQRAGVTRRDLLLHHPEESRFTQRFPQLGGSYPKPCSRSWTAITRPRSRSTGNTLPDNLQGPASTA